MTKQAVSKKSFVGAHVAVIVFHIILAMVVLLATWKSSQITLYISGAILLVVSLMSFTPILMPNKEYVIE